MFRTPRSAAALLIAMLLLPVCATAWHPPSQTPAGAAKQKGLMWDPPKLDAKLKVPPDAPPCDLDKVLARAADRANELVDNLQNFTARENVDFRIFGAGGFGDTRRSASESFDYTATLVKKGETFSVEESRKASQVAMDFPMEAQDIGLPEMALIFLPDLRSDYDMKCEAPTNWNGRAAWIVSFRQRKDRPNQTAAFSSNGRSYPASLRGRAWIAQDNGVVTHMEIALMHDVPAVGVRDWYLSIDYAPVRFRSKDVTVWLPQSAQTWAAFEMDHVVMSHTFSDFFLFSVQTTQEPTAPSQ
jgi:hypothetical protein